MAGILAALAAFIWAPGLLAKARATGAGRRFTQLSYNKFYVDEIYDLAIVKPFGAMSLILFYVIDRALIDCVLVGGAGLFVRVSASVLRRIQTGRIPAYAVLFVVGVLGLLTLFLWAAG